MDENDQSHFKLRSGFMLNVFLESDLLKQIKKIQKNQNLKDERDVVIRAIEHYYQQIISGVPKQKEKFDEEFSKTTFDGEIDFKKLEDILMSIKSEELIKKLPQHKIYNLNGAGMMHRFQTKILPVKFSLMCLSKMIVEQNSPWVDLNELKNYALDSAKSFVKKFDSSSIQNKFKVKTGFPTIASNEFKSDDDMHLLLARSSKRFTEEFVGRKLQKHEGIQLGGSLFEMGLIKAKNEKNFSKILVTLSESGQEFVSYTNPLIDFVYKNISKEPSSIFSQQERQFYLKKILPKFDFENNFVKNLMKHQEITHSSDIKEWFKKDFEEYCKDNFPDEHVDLPDNSVRVRANTIMGRLMEFEIFTKDPQSKSGPYTRMKNMYFAYGSNLSISQMDKRCPDNIALDIGRLNGYRWIISNRGYANVIESENDYVLGRIYEINNTDEASLDKEEGVKSVNSGYDRTTLPIIVDGVSYDCLVYVDPIKEEGPPKDEYVNRINLGLADSDFPTEYVEKYIRPKIPLSEK